MKRLFTLIITVLTVTSLIGQSPVRTSFTKADLHQKSIKKVMEMVSPKGLNQDFKKHPEFSKNNQENKSAKEIKQVLDSMDNTADGMVYYRERYTYNTQGNCTLIEGLHLDEAGTLYPSFKSEYSYSNTGNMISYTYSYWDEDLNDWYILFKMEYTYSNDLLTNGNMFTWDMDSNEWDLVIKEEFSYDGQDRLTSILTLVDNNGTWEQEYKEEVSYNTAGYAYLWLDYYWDPSTSTWTPDLKDEDIFDANGDIEMNVESLWDEMQQEWVDEYKSEFVNNDNHQILTEVYFEYDLGTMQWVQLGKDEYSYDEQGNIITTITSAWDGTTWILSYKEELSFDYTVSNDEVVYPNEYSDFEYTHKLTDVMNFIWDETWLDDEQYVFYYSEKDVNGIGDVSVAEISVYPNPSTGVFSLEISGFGTQFSISVLDFAGRVVAQEEVNNSNNEYKNTLDLSNYSKGVYFLKFSSDIKSDYQKIVIQ